MRREGIFVLDDKPFEDYKIGDIIRCPDEFPPNNSFEVKDIITINMYVFNGIKFFVTKIPCLKTFNGKEDIYLVQRKNKLDYATLDEIIIDDYGNYMFFTETRQDEKVREIIYRGFDKKLDVLRSKLSNEEKKLQILKDSEISER